MNRVKVLIVDDHALIRRGLREILSKDDALEIVAEASDGNEAVEKARLHTPDVILMDLQMPNCNGLEATRRLRVAMPETRILVHTVSESEADLFDALKGGARGYLLKEEKPEMIIQAIHYTARGGIIISPPMATKLLSGLKPAPSIGRDAARPPAAPSPHATAQPVAEKAVVGHPAAQPATGAPESHPEMPTPAQVAGGEPLIREAELVIAAPVLPAIILNLHKWLKETTKAEIGKITASWGGDTVVSVAFRDPTPLMRLLTGYPFVAQVAEESHQAEEMQRGGAPRPEFRRIRLVLKPA